MPVDLVCVTASFSRITRKLLTGIDGVDIVIDDKMVCTMSFRHHLQMLKGLLAHLREARLTAKPSKCHFCF